MSAAYRAGNGNKYQSPDGSECVYDENGDLVDEGSYNFTPDYRPESVDNPVLWQHVLQDVLPAWLGGECHQGQTTVY